MIRAALLTLTLALPATAQDVRPPDQLRLDRLEATLGGALREALAQGAPEDVTTLTEALADPPEGDPMEGDWFCRVAKMGGLTPLVVYDNFRCRITAVGETWVVQKTSGSQRFKGTIRTEAGRHLFLGVGHVGEAPATDYAGLPREDQTPVEPNQTTAEIGVFEPVSNTKARLLLPAPLLESEFDLIIFSR